MDGLFYSLVTGFAIGSLGSLHCIGMCGPLALSLPVHTLSKRSRMMAIGFYHFGRVITYSCIGLGFGLFGMPFRLWGIQQAISIGSGLLILGFAALHFKIRFPFQITDRAMAHIRTGIQKTVSTARTSPAFFLIGLLNGLLPCGLVYVAVLAAFATGQVWMSGVLMFAFGLGTLPALAGLMFAGNRVSIQHRQRMRRFMPYAISIMAGLLILRGLNLGIPFVSPRFGEDTKEIPTCHTREDKSILHVTE